MEEKFKIDPRNLKELISEAQIQTRVLELAKQIQNDFNGEEITFICILKGASYFFTDLTRRIESPARLDFMRVSSYGSKTTSGEPELKQDLSSPIEGKNVIVVEDIVDSGKTLKYLLGYLGLKKPKNLKLCCLLDKPSRRADIAKDLIVDYVGFTVPNFFVVGYGLDFDELYRNSSNILVNPMQEKDYKEIEEFQKKLLLK